MFNDVFWQSHRRWVTWKRRKFMPATPFARDTSRSLEKDPLSSALQLSCFYGNHNFWNMCLCSVLFLTSSVYFFAILLPPETLSYSSFSPLNHLQAKFFLCRGPGDRVGWHRASPCCAGLVAETADEEPVAPPQLYILMRLEQGLDQSGGESDRER